MDFKSTLNLPNPDFSIPMKADLAKREPSFQARWAEMGLYEKLQAERKDCETFVLHDGPPYTNGPIHIGTAMNKILKDFVVKSQSLMGKRAPYVPGYDNHGLPIEQAVMKKFAEQKQTPTTVELRRACRAHAEQYIEVQTKQFERLGVFGMWDRPYTSMEFRYEAEIIRVFKHLVENGYIYRGLRPVLWSPTSQTALADTEIVYKPYVSKAIYVRFLLRADKNNLFEGLSNVSTIIWTTTPWTIPANVAVAFHPRLSYSVVRVDDQHYIMIDQLVEKTLAMIGTKDYETVRQFIGQEVEGTEFSHPVFDRVSVAVLADYVTTEDGTGVVHTAPGHGREDFLTGQKYKLPTLCPVDGRGVLTEEAGEFAGVFYKKCDTVVVDRLRELGALLAVNDYEHTYPHAERDDQPVIFRATEQWFIGIDQPFHANQTMNLREVMLAEIEKTKWIPESGHGRIKGMIAGRPDWCISRQRPWGVGIPIFYGAESGEPVLDPDAIEFVAKVIEREGSDAWYANEAEHFLPNGYVHPQTGETSFRKEVDVFDVWFDSGCTAICVLGGKVEPRWKEAWPADLFLEGSDQHRGWFNVSLILGCAVNNSAPYREVLTHGMVTDQKGQKMAKRLGNTIDPVTVSDQFGADILRYWAASVNYEDDVPCSEELLKVAGDGYRTIRNTLRFLQMNLSDYNPSDSFEKQGIDLWVENQTNLLVNKCFAGFRDYSFNRVLSEIHSFCNGTLSRFYLDAIKDRMYCDGANWPGRRGAQASCHAVLITLTKLIAPILPHTAEEVYDLIPFFEKRASVHLEALSEPIANALPGPIDAMLAVRGRVFTALELWKEQSGIKNSQEIDLILTLAPADFGNLENIHDLANLFKVASVELRAGDEGYVFAQTKYLECERSRLRRPDVLEVVWQGESVRLSARDRKAVGI